MNLTRQEQSRLLDCGAEIGRVEDTLNRMGHAYGAEQMNVFVIPSLISVSMSFPDSEAITETRRIHSFGNTDFYRLEKINAMSRQCSVSPIPLDELRARLDKIAHGHKPFFMVIVGSILGFDDETLEEVAFRIDADGVEAGEDGVVDVIQVLTQQVKRIGIINLVELDAVDAEERIAARTTAGLEAKLHSELINRGELDSVECPFGIVESCLISPRFLAARYL